MVKFACKDHSVLHYADCYKGVDIALWAHEHEYQRMWPVYNRTVYNGTDSSNPYENPGAPVHIVTGSAVSYSSVT